jgi:hypothetical protein
LRHAGSTVGIGKSWYFFRIKEESGGLKEGVAETPPGAYIYPPAVKHFVPFVKPMRLVFRGGDRVFERKGAAPYCYFNHLRLSSCPPLGRQINKWEGKKEIRKDKGEKNN